MCGTHTRVARRLATPNSSYCTVPSVAPRPRVELAGRHWMFCPTVTHETRTAVLWARGAARWKGSGQNHP